ncbi:MAG: type VI secretion system baseplate subunit TssK, partial [Janthinobacterium sp.]
MVTMESAMTLPAKLLWSEGLAIGPQQFQQLDRYHEARLQRLVSLINPHLWGVHAVTWNRDALANNSLRADTMSLVFQDGEICEAPLSDALPSAIDLSKLPPDEHSFTFYAALPAMQAHGGNVSSAGARYAQADIETPDLYSEAVSIDVAYLKKRVYLLSQLDPLHDYLAIPLVRLHRGGNGSFDIDTSFIPPC